MGRVGGKKSPCCNADLVRLTESERLELLKEFGLVEDEVGKESIPEVSDLGVAGIAETSQKENNDDVDVEGVETGLELVFEDGFASTTKYMWDGKIEHMPREWMNKGYYVIATYAVVSYREEWKHIMDGEVHLHRGRQMRFTAGKESYKPKICQSYMKAVKTLNIMCDLLEIKGWEGIERKNERKVYRYDYKANKKILFLHIIPIENYSVTRRRDVLEELRAKSLEEDKKCIDYGKEKEFAEIARGLIENGRPPRNISGEDDEDYGRPLDSGIVEDWSKVDWSEEDRISAIKEKEFRDYSLNTPSFYETRKKLKDNLADIRRANRGIAKVSETAKWLLQDWTTDKYLKIVDKRVYLVEMNDCTYFERLGDANKIALEIERQFWNPAFVKMRLHVVPHKE